jgi:hypothetical protein
MSCSRACCLHAALITQSDLALTIMVPDFLFTLQLLLALEFLMSSVLYNNLDHNYCTAIAFRNPEAYHPSFVEGHSFPFPKSFR